MKKFTYISALILLFLLIANTNLPAQSTGKTVVLLTGKVTDRSGSPVGTTIFFNGDKGKKTQAKSNTKDGAYQIVLNPGENFSVTFKDFMTTGNTTVNVPEVSQYTEQKMDFSVQKLETGYELMKFTGFAANSASLSGNSSFYMTQLKDFLDNNLKANVVATIHMHDCQFKVKEKKVETLNKKNKKTTTKVKISVEEQATELFNERVAKLKQILQQSGIAEKRVVFEKDLKMDTSSEPKEKKAKKDKKDKKATPKQTESKSVLPNVVITIGRIMNL